MDQNEFKFMRHFQQFCQGSYLIILNFVEAFPLLILWFVFNESEVTARLKEKKCQFNERFYLLIFQIPYQVLPRNYIVVPFELCSDLIELIVL